MISYDCIKEINEITNHPSIYEYHLLHDFDGPIDTTSCFERGGFGVIGEGFGFLLDPVVPGVYEVHTSILPEYRKRSSEITKQSMGEVFTQTSTLEIVTRIKNNPAARRLATSVGMQKTFERGDMEYFSIHVSRWAVNAKEFIPLGEKFHEMLVNAGIELGHDEYDENHNQYSGIAVAMVEAGLRDKAVWFYNTWAKLADFYQLEWISENSVFAGNSVIEIVDDKLRVVPWEPQQQ